MLKRLAVLHTLKTSPRIDNGLCPMMVVDPQLKYRFEAL